jgi:hypothetical protein
MAFCLLSHRQPRSVAALAGRRQSSLIDGDNFGSPLATYEVSVSGRTLTRTCYGTPPLSSSSSGLKLSTTEPHNADVHASLHGNGFSEKRSRTMRPAVALYFMHHNFWRIHQRICVTPAVNVWRITFGPVAEVVGLLQ